ncbi:MAG: peptide chain release factor N(5)-glutamine methyltransferase [Candidatus Cloacimonetes bacterium]|nr:peptide chain release factor N(5)-glutamine methyltransferase [Candidatus Cloacimonadota bacterium]
MQTLLEALNKGISLLQEAETENPFLEAELLLEHLVQIPRLELHAYCFEPIDDNLLKQYFALISRRATFEPVQYIIGNTQFLDFIIKVTPDVLIPRPETELLVDYIKHDNPKLKHILEIGTGSGAIAIALKSYFPEAEIIATDISGPALEVARENALATKLEIEFVHADIFPVTDYEFDLIVSNPPYISAEDYDKLPAEVKNFEPQGALLARENGLFFYRMILEKAESYLSDKGVIFFEIGEEQGNSLILLAKDCGFEDIDIYQDLCGKDRYARISGIKVNSVFNLL